MYESHGTVPKDRLRDFVRGAECLQIRGLPSDLVQNYLGEATEKSVVCRKKVLPSQLSHNDMRCSPNSGDSSHLEWATSISGNETGGERFSTYMQMDLSEENVSLQPQSILDSVPNRETMVFPEEKKPSLEPKEELDVEDTPIWESEDENNSEEADLSSATAGEGVQNKLTPVPGTIRNRRSLVTSPRTLERESATSDPNFSSVSISVPSSTDSTSATPLVPIVPTEQSGCAMEDSCSCMMAELPEHCICVKNEPVVKTEVIPAVVSLHRETVVAPMHEVWLEELRSWESEEVISETDSAENQETRFQDQCENIDYFYTAGAHGNNQPAVRTNDIFKDIPSSFVVRIQKKLVSAQEVKETELDEWCIGQECKSIGAIENIGDRVVKSGRQSTVQVHNDNLLNREHEMKGQEIKVEMLERAVETDVAVEQSDAGEDSAPLSERVSKMLGKKLHRCRRCPGAFCTLSELQLHVENVHKKKSSKRCEVCLATFAFESDLMRHKMTHTGKRPFKCEVCEKSFNQSSHLTTHKLIHTGERPFTCEVCEKSFNQSRHLIRHKLIHTGERPFKCGVCEKSFNQSSNLIRHKLIHTGERPFKCGVCEKSFNQTSHLTRHKLFHTGERPFTCEVCEKSFNQSSNLTTHKLIHTGERLFKCGVCEKSFNHSGNLTNHKRIHSGERPFQCDVCERSFGVKHTLITHMRKHTGERPFLCNFCKRSFTDKSSLGRHMRTHTG